MTNDPTKNHMHPDYNDGTDLWLSSSRTLRIFIGILGMLLPVLLYAVLVIDTPWYSPLESISHYYYTRAAGVFVIAISLLAIFLIIYKGKEPLDFWLSAIAGVGALCVVLFPTGNLSEGIPDGDHLYSVTVMKVSAFRENFHYISAAIFLLCLAIMSFFVFTRSDKSKEQRGRPKRRRNRVYRVCAVVMVIAVGVIFCGGFLGWIDEDIYNDNHLTFWMETVAVESFGFAWLVKGEVILKDNGDSILQRPDAIHLDASAMGKLSDAGIVSSPQTPAQGDT